MSPLSTTSVQKSPSAYLRQNVRSSSTSKELPTDKTSSSFNIDNYSMHRASPSINSTNEIKGKVTCYDTKLNLLAQNTLFI